MNEIASTRFQRQFSIGTVVKNKPANLPAQRDDRDVPSFRKSTINKLVPNDWEPIVQRGELFKITGWQGVSAYWT